MIKQFKVTIRLFCLGIVIYSLASCQVTSHRQVFPELTFQHLKSLNLKIAKLKIINSYNPPMDAPNVDHLFNTPPALVLNRWAKDRLRAVGTNGYGQFTIIEASVTETKLEKKKGIIALLSKDQSERYDAILEAKLEIFDDRGLSKGFAKARATRSITVSEDSSINQRKQVWFNLTEGLIRDINAELEKNIHIYLTRWLN